MSTGPAIVDRPQHRRKIRLPEVLRRTGLSRSTLYELMEKGTFPSEAKAQGTRTAMWWSNEVDDWNESPVRVNSQMVKAGPLPAQRQKFVSAGSETTQRQAELNGAPPRKQVSKKLPSTELNGLQKTGMTLFGREVYRHTASNRLLLDVGSLLADPPVRTEMEKTEHIH